MLQEASVCPVISLYAPLSDDGGPKWDCVFSNVTVLENGERVTIREELKRKWQRSPSWQHGQTFRTTSPPPPPDTKDKLCLENTEAFLINCI